VIVNCPQYQAAKPKLPSSIEMTKGQVPIEMWLCSWSIEYVEFGACKIFDALGGHTRVGVVRALFAMNSNGLSLTTIEESTDYRWRRVAAKRIMQEKGNTTLFIIFWMTGTISVKLMLLLVRLWHNV
jgi:hypothetical protein